MPRPAAAQTEAVNADSFLDIVASVVSIMIIMVVMEGSRIRNAPVDPHLVAEALRAEKAKSGQPDKGVAAIRAEGRAQEASIRGDIARIYKELEQLGVQAILRGEERNSLATTVAAMERKIADRRKELDAPTQQEFDLVRKLGDSRAELAQLKQQAREAANASPEPIQIAARGTPISRTVESEEVHFRLRAGRVAVVPMDDLAKRVRGDAQAKVYKLRNQGQIVETVGPIDGFQLQYTLVRRDAIADSRTGRGGGSMIQLSHFELIPVAEPMGEPLAEALSPGSPYRQALAGLKPRDTAITLWVYPDSFQEFRQVREDLHRLGYSVAARPLTETLHISGSPQGSKSAAE